VLVHLPPGYAGEPQRRYPVIYLQDGQNLFNPETAFVRGQDWRAHETADRLTGLGAVEPVILVAVHNTGSERLYEYTPWENRAGQGGGAARYLRLLAEELKPMIDREYRTRSGAGDTAIGGSSLGGLLSLYAGLSRPDVFGQAAAMSPSVWWSGRRILRHIRRMPAKPPLRLWLDTGTAEGDSPRRVLEDTRALRDALLEKGWRAGVDLEYLEAEGAGHDERAWGARFGQVLRFLFPPR
jgi:predicted alpha/beta superfamily hydrolase